MVEKEISLQLPPEVMRLEQLPIIIQDLQSIKGKVLEIASNAAGLEVTEETLKACKDQRAGLNKLAKACEDRRKEINAAILKPYDEFLLVYDDCVRKPLNEAVGALNDKIKSTEAGIKARAEDSLRQYFSEVSATRHVDWLKYEQLGIKVGLTEAKSDNLKKLKQQIMDTVDRVSDEVAAIHALGEIGPEVMSIYRQTLDLAGAENTVRARQMAREAERLRMEQEKEEARRRQEIAEREKAMADAQRRVVSVFQPEAEKSGETQGTAPETAEPAQPADVYEMAFTVRGTLEQLRALKGYISASGLEVVE